MDADHLANANHAQYGGGAAAPRDVPGKFGRLGASGGFDNFMRAAFCNVYQLLIGMI